MVKFCRFKFRLEIKWAKKRLIETYLKGEVEVRDVGARRHLQDVLLEVHLFDLVDTDDFLFVHLFEGVHFASDIYERDVAV